MSDSLFKEHCRMPETLLLKRLQHMCYAVNFPKFSGEILFAGHLQTATSECSLFHDFSEKKTFILKARTTVNQKEVLKVLEVLL